MIKNLTKKRLEKAIINCQRANVCVYMYRPELFIGCQAIFIDSVDLQAKLDYLSKNFAISNYEVSHMYLVNKKKMIKSVDFDECGVMYFAKDYDEDRVEYGWEIVAELEHKKIEEGKVQFTVNCLLSEAPHIGEDGRLILSN